jgi:type III pantothenate kinase
MIGNSRLHWSYFVGENLVQTWNTLQVESIKELSQVVDDNLYSFLQEKIPLYLASVVPSATKIYLQLPQSSLIHCHKIPLKGIYNTMGVDRILALWGAKCRYQFPCLVVDSGTALTFTGANEKGELLGGGILPGVKLQLQSLFFNTASLPEIECIGDLTTRWAKDTTLAMQSGVIYTITAGIKDFAENWWLKFPESSVIITGGDALLLAKYLEQVYPLISQKITVDSDLIYWGMQGYLAMNATNK